MKQPLDTYIKYSLSDAEPANLSNFNTTFWRHVHQEAQDIAQPKFLKIIDSYQKIPVQLTSITLAAVLGISANLLVSSPIVNGSLVSSPPSTTEATFAMFSSADPSMPGTNLQ